MNYVPQLDDYVQWKHIEGWIYFIGNEYITIEVGVREKDHEQIIHGTHHRKDHTLVVCYHSCWKDLKYIKNRRDE
jgi:tRNA(His) 5'-end guanylyltransferase